MTRYHLILTALLLLLSGNHLRAQSATTPPVGIDDRQIKAQFEKGLGKLKDGGKTPDAEEIRTQLKELDHHSLEVPEIKALPAGRHGAPSTADIYSGRQSSVLCFGNIYKCDRCNNWHGNIAGGFVITDDGVAVTNYHVMDQAKAGAFGAMSSDGEIYVVEKILAASKRDDLAIVKLSGEGFQPTPLAQTGRVGERVVAISHPQGRFYTVSEGIVSRYYKQNGSNKKAGAQRLAITADFAKGSSGCPVFNASGEVIGVIASTNSIYYNRDKDGDESNLQMVIKSCIPSSAILRLLSPDAETEETVAKDS